jgi:hypothetical protein
MSFVTSSKTIEGNLMKYILFVLAILFSSPLFSIGENSQDEISLLQEKEFLTKMYKRYIGEEMNWENPRSLTEKIQWLKLYNRHPIQTICSDKYLVRNYVTGKIGAEYLVPLLGVYDNANEIDFSKLPSKFVLKTNHGSGWNIICKDKTKLNQKEARDKLNKWLQEDYSVYFGEWAYKNIPRKIICEQFIGTETGDLLDYKFYCFNGEPKFVLVCGERSIRVKFVFYSLNWERIHFYPVDYPIYTKPVPKPQNLEKMTEIAEKLSEGFKFVRVDLYNIKGQIYFGEMTLYTTAGIVRETGKDNIRIGGLLNLYDPTCPY